MARPQKFRHSREALNDPQIATKLGGLVLDIEALRTKRKQIDDQLAAAFDAVDDAGFEKKFVRKVVSLRAKETDARRDEEEGLEAYETAVEKGVSLACARSKPVSSQSYAEAKGGEPATGKRFKATRYDDGSSETTVTEYDLETGEILALTDTQEQPETANEPAHPRHEDHRGAETAEAEASAPHSPSPANAPRLAADDEAAQASQSSSATISNPQPNLLPGAVKAGDVPPPSSPAALSEADVPAFLKTERRKTSADYRPHCRHPDNCGSSNPTGYCYQCRKAMEAASETEEA